jgi:hypothetical protein
MRFAVAFLLFMVLRGSAAAAPEPVALRDGEQLVYRVSWGIFPHAGEIKIAARNEMDGGKPYLVVTTLTSTRGILRRLFPFEAKAESIFERNTGRLIVLTESSASGRKKTNTAMEFDYSNWTARFTDFANSANNQIVPVPQGEPMDLIMSLVQTRSWNLKPGDTRDADVVFEKDIYQLTIHALGYEDVETKLGKFKTLLLEPRMEKTPPKGMFKRGSKVHVWIAQDDDRHLPVKFEVEFKFGAGVSTLESYTPPTAEAK